MVFKGFVKSVLPPLANASGPLDNRNAVHAAAATSRRVMRRFSLQSSHRHPGASKRAQLSAASPCQAASSGSLKLMFAPSPSANPRRCSARPLEPPNEEFLWHRNKSSPEALISLVRKHRGMGLDQPNRGRLVSSLCRVSITYCGLMISSEFLYFMQSRLRQPSTVSHHWAKAC